VHPRMSTSKQRVEGVCEDDCAIFETPPFWTARRHVRAARPARAPAIYPHMQPVRRLCARKEAAPALWAHSGDGQRKTREGL